MKYILFLITVLVSFTALSQNNYRSTSNSMYWKNKKPFEGYWQQDVAYKINANINEKTRVIEAVEELEYWNNSPHALNFVYFHLYQNAFVKNSYLDQLHKVNNTTNKFGKYHEQGLGTTISNLEVNGELVKYEIDNTIMKVYLPNPLLPNQSIRFSMKFNTFFDWGTMRSRMNAYNAWGRIHFNGVHWYPRICVYDKKKGWDTDQHLNKELYGDYGTFDVELSFANDYIVEATGVLQNKSEVLPQDIYNKLLLTNFANKKWNEPPSIIIPQDSTKRKTWKYYAENVHDFAFTADPSYRIGDKEITLSNGHKVNCVAVVQESHASKWQNATDYIEKIIRTFSADFGNYEYPKIVAADANDGMEYPMITLDGGGDPGYRGLLVHEIGHNWFYGMIGNNETYRAALDEGFTQFLTAWGLERIDGKYMVEEKDKRKYVEKNRNQIPTLDRNIYNRYINDAMRGIDKPLNTHSNDFNSALGHENGYSNVYHKTATMLYNLQYVLGDTLFQNAMKHYVSKWKMCHPYFEDFRDAIIDYTHVDLNWFFDQWLETTKNTDYSINGIKKTGDSSYKISFSRLGEMQMPIDFSVYTKTEKYDFHIPNTNVFKKETNATILPKWYGWDKLNEHYNAEIKVAGKITKIEIDPSYRLADIDMKNNSLKKSILNKRNTNILFDYGLRQPANRRQTQLYWRPDIWYSKADGAKLGLHFEKSYMNYLHKNEGSIWLNTRSIIRGSDGAVVNYTYTFDKPLKKISNNLYFNFHKRFLEDVSKTNFGFKWFPNSKNSLSIQYNSLSRYVLGDNAIDENEWSSYYWPQAMMINWAPGYYNTRSKNRYIQGIWTKTYRSEKETIVTNTTVRLPLNNALMSDNVSGYDMGFIQFEWLHKNNGKKLEWKNRLFARLGWGSNVPSESALYAAGANPEEMAENKYSRSLAFIPTGMNSYDINNFGNFQMGGGLNLRAYNNYYATYTNDLGQTFLAYKSLSGISYNTELDFDNYIKLRPKYTRNWLKADCYLFFDAGMSGLGAIQSPNYTILVPASSGLSAPRVDAGIGTAFTIKHFGRFEKAEPLTIRFDYPIFVNKIPEVQSNTYFSLQRWVVGINRCF